MHSRPLTELGFSEARFAQVPQIAERFIERNEISGIVVAVARHHALAQLSAHGLRDVAAGTPMSVDTLFRIYSMTKPLTTAAALLLVERARIRFGDTVSTFFPEFRTMDVYLGGEEQPFRTTSADREITIWDLLTHTAGLAYGIGDEHPVEKEFERRVWGYLAHDPNRSLREMAAAIAEVPLVHQPGTAWRYSAACDLIAAVVEEVTGRPYAEFLTDELLAPLGMSETWFTVPYAERGRLAVVYEQTDAGLEPTADPPVMSFVGERRHPNGGGGLVSTATDYLAFAELMLNRGRVGSRQVLAPRTVDLMMTNHLPDGIDRWPTPGAGFGFGGSVVTGAGQFRGYQSEGAFSWGGAASTLFWADPALDLSVVLMLQRVPGFASRVTDDLLTSVYQAIVE